MKDFQDVPKAKNKGEQSRFGFYFLGVVIVLYLLLFFFNSDQSFQAFLVSLKLLLRIIPALLLVVLFMAAMKHYINPGVVKKAVGKGSGLKGWILAILTGLLSHGPIYVWFPFLKELRDQGMSNGLISVFLYNRAVKIPLLPAMIAFLGCKLVLILMFYMFVASLLQGAIINFLFDRAET